MDGLSEFFIKSNPQIQFYSNLSRRIYIIKVPYFSHIQRARALKKIEWKLNELMICLL